MGSSKLISFLVSLVSFAVLVRMAAAGEVDLFKPIEHICPSFENPDQNFTIGSQYEKNLDLVLYNLSITAPSTPTGFAYGSAGVEENMDPTYGQAQCRGDISTADCQTCVGKIVKWIREKCPVQKSAFAWFEGCLLKYSNIDSYGKLDESGWCIINKQNLTGVVSAEKMKEFLVGLSEEAYASKNMFAKGVVEVSGSRNLYGSVQCTGDASLEVCKTCMGGLIDGMIRFYALGTHFYRTLCTLEYSIDP